MVKDELEFSGYEDYTLLMFPQQKKVASMFFYSIFTNYSIQTYISQDYKDELTISYLTQLNENVPGDSIWMDNLFNKNDGYYNTPGFQYRCLS